MRDELEKFDGNDLKESTDGFGAMVCDYSTFRSIYRLFARSALRNGQRSVLSTIRVRSSNPEEEIFNVSNNIGAAIAGALRRDDIVTGFDTRQYLVLLSNITLSDGELVLNRILDRIRNEIGTDIEIETSIQALKPAEG